MRYIKEYNEQYYTIIPYYTDEEKVELNNIISNSVPISLSDIKMIMLEFKGCGFSVYDKRHRLLGISDIIKNYGIYHNRYNKLCIHRFLNGVVCVWSLGDEWYVVSLGDVYYKCDQISGLVKLIKDKL